MPPSLPLPSLLSLPYLSLSRSLPSPHLFLPLPSLPSPLSPLLSLDLSSLSISPLSRSLPSLDLSPLSISPLSPPDKERRQQERSAEEDPTESISRFLASFADDRLAIESRIATISSAAGEEEEEDQNKTGVKIKINKIKTREILDSLAGDISHLEARVSQSSYFLPPYERSSTAAAIAQLRKRLEACRQTTLPKKRFAFTGKKITKAATSTIVAAAADTKLTTTNGTTMMMNTGTTGTSVSL